MNINIDYPAGKAGLIQVVDGLLSADFCHKFLSRMHEIWSYSFPGVTLGGVSPKTKLSTDLHYSSANFNEHQREWTITDVALDKEIWDALSSAIAIYKQKYNHLDHWVNVVDSGYQVQKYDKSRGYYRHHVDCFPMHQSTVSDRVLAVVIYLADVEIGGETNFPIHEIAVTPKAGRIVLFPATWTHLHESCVPISGDKWIISSFINNGSEPPEPLHDHLHDEHGNHIEDYPPLILGQTEVTDGES